MHFQVLFCKQKDIRVFQWQEDISVVVMGALLSENHVSVFEILIFSQDIWETFILSLKSTSFPKELW